MTRSIRANRHRSSRVTPWWFLQLLVPVAVIALAWTFTDASASEPETTNDGAGTEAKAEEWRHVTRVIDGDTLVLDGGERVRLIRGGRRAYLREATLRSVRKPGTATLVRDFKSTESREKISD
jgi:hypothetical protein